MEKSQTTIPQFKIHLPDIEFLVRTGTRKDLQVSLKASRWALVGQDYIRKPIRKSPAAHIGVDRKWLGGWLDLWVGTQPIQGRNVGPNTGVRWQFSSKGRPSVLVAAVSAKHVAEKASLFVALLVQLNEGRSLQWGLLNANGPLRWCCKG